LTWVTCPASFWRLMVVCPPEQRQHPRHGLDALLDGRGGGLVDARRELFLGGARAQLLDLRGLLVGAGLEAVPLSLDAAPGRRCGAR
jgi:hypothetical protein